MPSICRWTVSLVMGLATLLLPSCAPTSASALNSPLPVSNWTGYEQVIPDAKFDAVPITNGRDLLIHLKLTDESGKPVSVAQTDRPIIFEAYWCPHCQRTLITLFKDKDFMALHPIVVSMGYPPDTTLSQAVATSQKEFDILGLSGFTVYYSLGSVSQDVVPSYPTVIFTKRNKMYRLTGEHTSLVWHEIAQ